jgi:hypothetical protein
MPPPLPPVLVVVGPSAQLRARTPKAKVWSVSAASAGAGEALTMSATRQPFFRHGWSSVVSLEFL